MALTFTNEFPSDVAILVDGLWASGDSFQLPAPGCTCGQLDLATYRDLASLASPYMVMQSRMPIFGDLDRSCDIDNKYKRTNL